MAITNIQSIQATYPEIQALMKDVVLPYLQHQFNYSTFVLANIGRQIIDALRANHPILIGRPTSFKAGAIGMTFPTATKSNSKTVELEMKHYSGRIKFPTKILEATAQDAQSWTPLLSLEADGLIGAASSSIDRQLLSNGTGVMGTVTALPGGNVIQVDSIRFFELGQLVDVRINAAGWPTTSRGTAYITDIDFDNVTITVDALPGGTVVNDFLVAEGALDAAGLPAGVGTRYESDGLASIFDTNNALHGLPATQYGWRPNRIDFANSFTEVLHKKALQQVAARSSVALTPSNAWAICSEGVERKIFSVLKQQNLQPVTMTFEGGYTGVKVNDIPHYGEYRMPANTIWICNKNSIRLYEMNTSGSPNTSDNVSTGKYNPEGAESIVVPNFKFREFAPGTILEPMENESYHQAVVEYSAVFGTEARNRHIECYNVAEA